MDSRLSYWKEVLASDKPTRKLSVLSRLMVAVPVILETTSIALVASIDLFERTGGAGPCDHLELSKHEYDVARKCSKKAESFAARLVSDTAKHRWQEAKHQCLSLRRSLQSACGFKDMVDT